MSTGQTLTGVYFSRHGGRKSNCPSTTCTVKLQDTWCDTGSILWNICHFGRRQQRVCHSLCSAQHDYDHHALESWADKGGNLKCTDTAALFGVTSNAGGNVKYYLFTNSGCSGTGTLISTVTVTGGNVPNSATHQFTSVGSPAGGQSIAAM